jgi:hypothetical protein
MDIIAQPVNTETERRNRRGLRCNTLAQQEARHMTRAQKAARREARIAEGVAHDKALAESHRRMVQLNTLCERAGIPWYVRLGCTADELEAMLQDQCEFLDAEAAAVADDRAELRASLRQF